MNEAWNYALTDLIGAAIDVEKLQPARASLRLMAPPAFVPDIDQLRHRATGAKIGRDCPGAIARPIARTRVAGRPAHAECQRAPQPTHRPRLFQLSSLAARSDLADCHSFSRHCSRISQGRGPPPAPHHPGLQPVEVDIDDRLRLEGQT